MSEETLTYGELAIELKVNPRTLKRWVDNGMPHLKGKGKKGSVRFVWKEVENWMKGNG